MQRARQPDGSSFYGGMPIKNPFSGLFRARDKPQDSVSAEVKSGKFVDGGEIVWGFAPGPKVYRFARDIQPSLKAVPKSKQVTSYLSGINGHICPGIMSLLSVSDGCLHPRLMRLRHYHSNGK